MNVPTPRRKAFTLIELLIVITIIGILSVALIPRLTGGPAKARDAQRKAALQQIGTALEFYADDNSGAYPAGVALTCVDSMTGDLGAYLTSIPDDPLAGNTYEATCGDGGYVYIEVDGGFLLFAQMENVNASGTGLYDGTPVAGWVTSAASTANANFSAAGNVAALCETADCVASDNIIYVFGR